MLINNISKVITKKIASELLLSADRQAIIEYGLINLLSQLLTVILLLVAAYFLGIVREVIIIGLCSASLRRYSGGAHCSSPLRCTLLSIIVVPILVSLARIILNLSSATITAIILLLNIISIIAYFIYAPQDTPAKPIKNIKKIRRLKLKSMCLSIVILIISMSLIYFDFIFIAILMTLGSINQAITLTRLGKFYVNLSDKILKIAIP